MPDATVLDWRQPKESQSLKCFGTKWCMFWVSNTMTTKSQLCFTISSARLCDPKTSESCETSSEILDEWPFSPITWTFSFRKHFKKFRCQTHERHSKSPHQSLTNWIILNHLESSWIILNHLQSQIFNQKSSIIWLLSSEIIFNHLQSFDFSHLKSSSII